MTPTESTALQTDLSIRNESVQRVFNFYKNDLLIVNRRYQRKLIWTIEEKQRFIDSIIKGLPIPLILLAETEINGKTSFEIIDGMQRLNAINSFIEGEFSYEEKYFDLNTLVESKSLLDAGVLHQKTPLLSREQCEKFSSYILPVSIYHFTDERKVDEIFIRINSYGRHLSRQELRAAGTLESFGDLVRRVSSDIRTDVSHSDTLNLKNMKEISITNVGLDYGIRVDDLFWIKNSILTKEMVRASRDEEIVADLLSAISLPTIPGTSSNILDEYYGLKQSEKSEELSLSMQKIGSDVLHSQFLAVYNVIRTISELADESFRDLISFDNLQIIPRYFQVIFLAIHKLMFKEEMEVSSYPNLIEDLRGISRNIDITEGGTWSSTNRKRNIDSIAGVLRNCFRPKKHDPGAYRWLTEFESILMQSRTEQTSYDFKQGFCRLDGNLQFDSESFSKIIKTLTAIANNSPRSVGYVCVGVCDKVSDSLRVKNLYNVEAVNYRKFLITGVSHEVPSLAKTADDFYKSIINKIKSQPISDEAKDIISKNIRTISYYDKDVFVFKIEAGKNPLIYDGKYYVRHGSTISEVKPEQYPVFFQSYYH
jgi:hypothetical protein